jgi:hypothetical protein
MIYDNRLFEEGKSFGDAQTSCVRSATEKNKNGRLLEVKNLGHIDTSSTFPDTAIRVNGEVLKGKKRATTPGQENQILHQYQKKRISKIWRNTKTER